MGATLSEIRVKHLYQALHPILQIQAAHVQDDHFLPAMVNHIRQILNIDLTC